MNLSFGVAKRKKRKFVKILLNCQKIYNTVDKWCENVVKLQHVRHNVLVVMTNLETEGNDVYEVYHHRQEYRGYRWSQKCS